MGTPLDLKYISVIDEIRGEEKKIPSLHPQWKEEIDFLPYLPPPLNSTDKAAVEEWSERLTFIEDDLHTLLKMKHELFWCQVLFDESLSQCLDSYLKLAPRSYDVIYSFPEHVREQHNRVHRLVFMTYVRMATHKESKENFITPSVFGEILYENFLFDVPKLFDLCVLYGADNGQLLNKMISNIFRQQQKYDDDLRSALPTICQVLDNILIKCGLQPSSSSNSPMKLVPGQSHKHPLMIMSLTEFQDVLFYLADTVQTLWAFLDVYPTAAIFFVDSDFSQKLVNAYEQLVLEFHEAFIERDWGTSGLEVLLKRKLRESQMCILKSFRQIINFAYLQPLLDIGKNSEETNHHIEGYINAMSAILSERRFLAHHEMLFPFADDVDLLTQSGYIVDETRLQFLRDAINESYSIFGRPKQSRVGKVESQDQASNTSEEKNHIENLSQSDGMNEYAAEATFQQEDEDLGACAARVTGIELDSMISSVQDLLPELGDGFVERCLEEYNYNVEKIINDLLENKLPPSLKNVDRNIPRKPRPLPKEADIKSMLAERKNIYDDDEFDVFKGKKIDLDKVHQGKKYEDLSMKMLDDKSDLQKFKAMYDRYGNEDMVSLYDIAGGGEYDNYDDEYDDTYDTNLVGADDADSADELTERRPFTVPRVLGGGRTRKDNEDEDEDDEDEEETERKRDQFIQDPAKLREMREQRLASQQAHRNKGKGHGGGGGGGSIQQEGQAQGKKYDVKGSGVKGQGQSKDVQHNRRYKDAHKSSKANHNRRVLADKKRKI